ncbi:MAG TPA: hypothetical protein VHM19_15330 [Polyangiales bacterium]|jgi:hypothetical protein|nr:hypothetical protein [Polyangiales bacterium]
MKPILVPSNLIVAATLLCTVSAARAQEDAPSQPGPLEQRANTGLVIGAKLGGGLGLGELGASFVTELELGYMLPLPEPVGRSFELFVTGQYMQPSTTGKTTAPDARLPGDGTLHYDISEQILPITFGALYRLPLPTRLFMPYAGAGARLFLLRTKVTGSGGGEAFGKNEETGSKAGAYFALGADIFLGPGALLGELQLSYAPLDGYVLRNTNASSLSLAVGYRLML